ncbi:MAG: hypothetical protein QME74_09225 [Candidatus Edwardsbacteria bacterium]|nr:hypothetical protein [Candidatus Edwardsbacteria bacterium]
MSAEKCWLFISGIAGMSTGNCLRTDDQLDAIVKEMQGTTKIKVFGTREGEPLAI